MKPYGFDEPPRNHCYWCRRAGDEDQSRSREKRAARREVDDQLASALSQAELDLIACDAGACPHGCGGAR